MSDCNQMNCRNTCGGRQAQSMANRRAGMMGSAGRMQTRNSNYMRSGGFPAGSSCGCGRDAQPLSDMALAMGYVPWQVWRDVYEPAQGLKRATIFKELDKPFCGVRGGRRG